MKIGRAELTIQHPASSYGVPVLVLDGVAYGPEDMLTGQMAGAHIVCSDAVCGVGGRRLSDDAADQLCRWLSQSAAHGKQWIEEVRRSQAAPKAEGPEET